jgi:hypothetical protein
MNGLGFPICKCGKCAAELVVTRSPDLVVSLPELMQGVKEWLAGTCPGKDAPPTPPAPAPKPMRPPLRVVQGGLAA